MTTIDWSLTQKRLNAAKYPVGVVDGNPGKGTFTGLLAYHCQRQPDDVLKSIAGEMARVLPGQGLMSDSLVLSEYLAETAHESGGYTVFQENMKYSAKRICAVWPNRFPTLASALPFAWDPSDPDREDVALANSVYGSRMGNEKDGTKDNDGWDHRGGGILQHTGEEEYRLLKERLGYSPEDVRDPVKSVLASCDSWNRRGLTPLAKQGKFLQIRTNINGGTNGLEEIATYRSRLLKFLNK